MIQKPSTTLLEAQPRSIASIVLAVIAIGLCVLVEGAIVTGHEIVDWCRETLAEDKVPDLIRFLDVLPRTDTGKVRRVELSRVVQSESESV